jgi:hypothetical protein
MLCRDANISVSITLAAFTDLFSRSFSPSKKTLALAQALAAFTAGCEVLILSLSWLFGLVSFV